jgi:hypothetical protein
MKKSPRNLGTLLAAALGMSAFMGLAQLAPADDSAAKPFKILEISRIPAAVVENICGGPPSRS